MSMWQGKSFTRRLVGLLELNLKLENKTGLLIQMPIGAQAYRIGGSDKYPIVTKKKYGDRELEVPYIPGSSLKGRMRSLLELSLNTTFYTTDGKIWMHTRSLTAMKYSDFFEDVDEREVIDELFGWSSANYRQIIERAYEEETGSRKSCEEILQEAVNNQNTKKIVEKVDQLFTKLSITRLLVSDFFPSQSYINKYDIRSIADFLEEKPENRIDRITSAADPREVVRVKPGVEFEGTITMLFLDNDKDEVNKRYVFENYIDTLLLGLKLIEETYIGSSGSRGYGRVKITGERAVLYKIELPIVSSSVLKEIYKVDFNNLEQLVSKRDELVKNIKEGLFEIKQN